MVASVDFTLNSQKEKRLVGTHRIPTICRGEIYLVSGEWNLIGVAIQELIDRTAMHTEVKVVFSGGRFSLELLPLVMGDRQYEFEEVVDRIIVSAAESCFQINNALQHCLEDSTPLVLMDMLEPFYDDRLTDKQASGILDDCLLKIQEISLTCPVVISATQRQSRPHLFNLLEEEVSSKIWLQKEALPHAKQDRLF